MNELQGGNKERWKRKTYRLKNLNDIPVNLCVDLTWILLQINWLIKARHLEI